MLWVIIYTLTHWGREMAAVSQTTHLNAFSWMKMLEFRFRFHWSLSLRVQLKIIRTFILSVYLYAYVHAYVLGNKYVYHHGAGVIQFRQWRQVDWILAYHNDRDWLSSFELESHSQSWSLWYASKLLLDPEPHGFESWPCQWKVTYLLSIIDYFHVLVHD